MEYLHAGPLQPCYATAWWLVASKIVSGVCCECRVVARCGVVRGRAGGDQRVRRRDAGRGRNSRRRSQPRCVDDVLDCLAESATSQRSSLHSFNSAPLGASLVDTLQKNIRISTDILWPLGFTIPSIYGCKRIYGTGSVKMCKTRHEISVDMRILLTV